MKTIRFLLAVPLLGVLRLLAAGDPIDAAVTRAKLEATENLKTANAELIAMRARIDEARRPLEEATVEIERRVSAIEDEIRKIETDQANLKDAQQRLRRGSDNQRRQLGYLLSQTQEGMRALGDGLAPGERRECGTRVEELRRQLEAVAAREGVPAVLAAMDALVARLQRRIGGTQVAGEAVVASDNRVLAGRFLLVGPAEFFLSNEGGVVGPVIARAGGEWPVVQPLPGWTEDQARPVFDSGRGVLPLDASGGKALLLRQQQNDLLGQVRKGGVVGYIILAVGLLALIIAIQKVSDFRKLGVDEPAIVRPLLAEIAAGRHEAAERLAERLKSTTRELFLRGLRNREKPKAIIEEHLESYVLQQRMLQERRLPLLAVIATAGPLLGLLGTVTGMIKTFTLITVFGTGSAGKLSAGISEALIATKFGLMVAIPALVVHGFLSQRIQKHITMLERYALELVTAGEEARRNARREEVAK